MKTPVKEVTLTINDIRRKFWVGATENLLEILRRYSYFSVKSGCDDSTCGVCTVLLDGKPT
jgi:carbon-monoxide dehydrogenase small subunit